MDLRQQFPTEIAESYELYDYNHGALVLKSYFEEEYKDICDVLSSFTINIADMTVLGGNVSKITKSFHTLLAGDGAIVRGWSDEVEMRSREVAEVIKKVNTGGSSKEEQIIREIESGKVTHKIDFMKGSIAIDFEWNSKDQTFDRDLFAFQAFHDLRVIDVGVIITRGRSLQKWLAESSITYTDKTGKSGLLNRKYGASTTHWDKLIPRLEGGRAGGCPVLVFGITPSILQ